VAYPDEGVQKQEHDHQVEVASQDGVEVVLTFQVLVEQVVLSSFVPVAVVALPLVSGQTVVASGNPVGA
jgi:hypothetical protein